MARLEGAVSANVLLRQAQHRLATDDAPRALALAQAIVAGKLKNQRQVLLRGSLEAKAEDDWRKVARASQRARGLKPSDEAGDAEHLRRAN